MPTYIYWVDTTVEHGLNELIDEETVTRMIHSA
jgi:hypothetical protein